MADAYGVIRMFLSDDFVGNLDVIQDYLNKYNWSNSGEKWEKESDEGGECLAVNCNSWSGVQYPSVYPEEITGVEVIGIDGEVRILENPTEKDFGEAEDYIWDLVPLKKLAKEIAEGIESGWIELDAFSAEKMRYANNERLRINHDATATRTRIVVGRGYEENLFEAV